MPELLNRTTPPREFHLPLRGHAVYAGGPEGIGETPFDEVPEPETLEIVCEQGDDPRVALRKTLGLFTTGVAIITTRAGDDVHGMTANAFMSVSLEPPLVLISIDRRAKMCGILHEGARFGVNVLCETQQDLSDRFAGRPLPDDVGQPRFTMVHDTPLVDGALAQFVARVVRSYWGGDHSLFLGQALYAHTTPGTPLVFHGGRYERLGEAAAPA
jgi:flavin reductase (DIM6/NTAB) family NADH-FMN oxidoreductase RutF